MIKVDRIGLLTGYQNQSKEVSTKLAYKYSDGNAEKLTEKEVCVKGIHTINFVSCCYILYKMLYQYLFSIVLNESTLFPSPHSH